MNSNRAVKLCGCFRNNGSITINNHIWTKGSFDESSKLMMEGYQRTRWWSGKIGMYRQWICVFLFVNCCHINALIEFFWLLGFDFMRLRLAPRSLTLEFLTWALARHCSVCLYNGKLLITPCYAKYACAPWCGGCLGKSCLTPTNSVERSCECRPTFEQKSSNPKPFSVFNQEGLTLLAPLLSRYFHIGWEM